MQEGTRGRSGIEKEDSLHTMVCRDMGMTVDNRIHLVELLPYP